MRKRRKSFKVGGRSKKAAGDVEVVKYEHDSDKQASESAKSSPPPISAAQDSQKKGVKKPKKETASEKKQAVEKDAVKVAPKAATTDSPTPPSESSTPTQKAMATKAATASKSAESASKADSPVDAAEAQLNEIDRIIKTASEHMESLAEEKEEIVVEQEEPVAFDGISSTDEHIQLLEQELKNSHKQSQKLAHEIDLLKAEFEEEKKHLQSSVKNLRKELHRTEPLQDNKFFTLSRELREAVTALEDITQTTTNVKVDLKEVEEEKPADTANFPAMKVVKKEPDTNVDSTVKETMEAKPGEEGKKAEVNEKEKKQTEPKANAETKKEAEPMAKPEAKDDKKTDTPEKDKKKDKKSKKKGSKKKKMLITGGAAVAVLVALSGLISTQLFGEADVNDELVREYMNQEVSENGSVAGAATEADTPTQPETPEAEVDTVEASEPAVMMVEDGNGGVEIDASQNQVGIDDTIWETYEDSSLGIKIQYPLNAIKLNKTESNITFQRGNGYIFKIQKIETGLDLDEYWKQIQATNLNYQASSTVLQEQEALFLKLQEEVDFPGDRYLVKLDNTILDIWYATPSKKFDNNDMLRVDQMLKTLSFLTE